MLTVIIGPSVHEQREARRSAWKGPFADIDPRTVTPAELLALAATPALFGGAQGYRLQGLFSGKRAAAQPEAAAYGEQEPPPRRSSEDELSGDGLLAIASDLVQSPHTFILEEEELPAGPRTALAGAGAHIVQLAEGKKKEPFNVFALANALGRRDRKQLWLLLMRARENNTAAENIAGMLAWKARSMLLSARTPAEREWWATLSRNLVIMYHESHRGAGDLSLLLERLALTI